MPVRVFTYICALYGAYLFNSNNRRDYRSYIYISFEWIAFLICLIVSFLTSSGPIGLNWDNDGIGFDAVFRIIYSSCISRQLYAMSLTYLILMILAKD